MPRGLEHLGIPGPDFITEHLAASDDPEEWINQFQLDNSVLLPSLRPALPLMDLHDIPRRDFHQSLIDVLKEQLKVCLDSACKKDAATLSEALKQGSEDAKESNNKVIQSLVEKNFVLIEFEPLQDILFDALSRLPEIPNGILSKIEKNKALYKHKLCALSVKRQIWQNNQNLFGEEISPLLSEYIKKKDVVMYSVNDQDTFISSVPKIRRQNPVIKKLVDYIGSNIHLYDVILQFLRTLFLKTRNVHYCTLRTELLMKFHDDDKKLITNVDPCYRFTWCMDACLKEKEVDAKRAKEMCNFVHSLKKEQSRVLGDLSMIVCDPYTVNTLVHSAFRQLQLMAARKGLFPKRSDDCLLLLRLLTLGISAWEIIEKQNFKEPKVDPKLLNNFCPLLASLLIDDLIKPIEDNIHKMQKLIDPSGDDKVQGPKHSQSEKFTSIYEEEIPPSFAEGIENHKIAGHIAGAYLNHLAKSKNKPALLRVLKCVLISDTELPYMDTFLHQFVFSLASMADEFRTDSHFRDFIFQEYFLPRVKKDSVLRHCLRLLNVLRDKLPRDVLQELCREFQPPENCPNQMTVELHQKLLE